MLCDAVAKVFALVCYFNVILLLSRDTFSQIWLGRYHLWYSEICLIESFARIKVQINYSEDILLTEERQKCQANTFSEYKKINLHQIS